MLVGMAHQVKQRNQGGGNILIRFLDAVGIVMARSAVYRLQV